MSTAVRKPAPRIARPAAVYRRGQAPKGVSVAELSDSDEDEGVEGIEAEQDEAVEDMPLRTIEGDAGEDESGHEEEDKLRSMKTATGKMNIALRDVNIKEGKVIVAGREESGRTTMEGKSANLISKLECQSLFNRTGGIGRGRGSSR